MVVIILISNPLWKSEARIATNLLHIMPVGTSMEDVISIVENHKSWTIRFISYDRGFIMGPSGPEMGGEPDGRRTLIGEKAMRLHLGQYYAYFFIQTDVSAFIAFDENSNLVRIVVRKSMNVL